MIGQKQLLQEIEKQINNKVFPRFCILVGTRGSGKKLLADSIAKSLNTIPIRLEDNSIASVRDMIEKSYKIVTPTTFIIPDADSMSIAARNAMLKVVEEPPNNAYYIMTLEDANNTLETIRSRGTMFYMNNYSAKELEEYLKSNYKNEYNLFIANVCDTPGEIDKLYSMCNRGIEAFQEYVNLVIDSIATVSGANAFKIANQVALKDTDEGYDLRLFWKAFMCECWQRYQSSTEDIDSIEQAIHITDISLQQLRIKGVNRLFLMDKWILDIRRVWMED